MPPALVLLLLAGWVERALWGPTVPPAPPQIDTMLGRGPVMRTIDDAVTIEADVEAAPTGEADDTGWAADGAALGLVRDDTVFRSSDQSAWFQIWQQLRAEDSAGERPRGREVTFAQLYSQPRSFRGKRVRIAGTIRRLQEVPAPSNAIGIDRYWQAWLDPAGGPSSPVVCYFLSLPPGTPTGMRVDVPAIVDGVFFKRWAYQAGDGIRLAPLLMAIAPRSPPRIVTGRGTSPVVGWALLSIAMLIGATWLALRFAGGKPAAARHLPPRLDVDFSTVTTDTPGDGLRRMADADARRESAS